MIFNLTQPVLDSAPKFTYTGTYEYIDDGGGNWRIKFLTSGTFTPLKAMTIDAFLVGGGGGGNIYAGGGGGYTKTVKTIELTPKYGYTIVVGSGGTGINDSDQANTGGITSAFNETANGGSGAVDYDGGAGGSGGGAAGYRGNGAKGGEDGGSGGSTTLGSGGTGQGTTTREFGESTGALYSGGGGGGAYSEYSGGAGGQGGGGDGGAYGYPGSNGETNTGGGGGSGSYNGPKYGGTGGSGIVIIRKHKEAAA